MYVLGAKVDPDANVDIDSFRMAAFCVAHLSSKKDCRTDQISLTEVWAERNTS